MGKTLKVCLAMGGGVSLGSFSGAALTEALKLLILYGQDKNGKPYEKVVLDGMSGASAGAIALTIMLKALIDYKTMMKIYNKKVAEYEDKTDVELLALTGTKHRDKKVNEALLVQELATDYFKGDTASANAHTNIEELKALQLAQKVQQQIWTKQLTAKNLYGKKLGKYKMNPHDSFGLLDREVLLDSAEFYLTEDLSFDLGNVQVLDKDRVVFACSLTNLVPIEIEKQRNGKIPALKQNAFKSTGSQNHAELRVFDFVFNTKAEAKKNTDACWFQVAHKLSESKSRNPGMNLTFKSPGTWAILASSALACGAFPFAFEPVVLKRYKQEYEQHYWPKVFDDVNEDISKVKKNNSFFNELDDNKKYKPIDYESFNFPYIDGGTFNNEPIREAFKIGSFQDFGKEDIKEEEDFERLVLFVDPAVRQEKYGTFTAGSFQSVQSVLKKPKSIGTEFNKELSKFVGNIGSTVGLLANQGSIKEEHRIRDIEESLKLRKELFYYIHNNKAIHAKITIKLISRAFNKIQANLNQGVISIGTRNVIAYFENEMKRVCNKVLEKVEDCHLITKAQLKAIEKGIGEDETIKDEYDDEGVNLGVQKLFAIINEGFTDIEEIEERKALFAQTVFRVLTDFSLRTVGKNANAEYMAILPISPQNLQTIELPGDEVEAFAGFVSYQSREYAFEYGKLSTLTSLKEKEDGFRKKIDLDGIVEDKNNPIIAHKDLGGIYDNLEKKISGLEFYKEEYNYEKDIKQLYKLSVKRLVYILFPPNTAPFFKHLKTSASKLGKGILVSIGVLLPFKRKLIQWLFSTFKVDGLADVIKYKTLLPITISIISDSALSKKIRIEYSEGNTTSKLRMTEHLLEDGKRKYQYLFQLHYLEYMKKNVKASKNESIAVNKIDPKDIDKVGLAIVNKVLNPSLDSNVAHEVWRSDFEKGCKKIEIKNIKIDNKALGKLKKTLNDKESSLHHSIKHLNYHVSPMLEYDMEDEEKGWYFKDNTTAFYHNLK